MPASCKPRPAFIKIHRLPEYSFVQPNEEKENNMHMRSNERKQRPLLRARKNCI